MNKAEGMNGAKGGVYDMYKEITCAIMLQF